MKKDEVTKATNKLNKVYKHEKISSLDKYTSFRF